MTQTKAGFRAGYLLCVCAFSAFGAIYTEIGDAGQLIGAAQSANSLPAGTALTAIQGTLSGSEADIFAIYLTGGQTFSATTGASSLSFNNFDTQLFLFNSSGLGVYANDDDPNTPPQSTLPASITLTPSVSGIYYLAIAGTGFLPTSAGGYIFPVSGGLLDQSGGGSSGAVGPTGPGGGSALSGWAGVSNETGDYEIVLTGTEFLPVPEPASTLLIETGFCVLSALYHRRRS